MERLLFMKLLITNNKLVAGGGWGGAGQGGGVGGTTLHGCESWTIKKAENQTIDAFKLVLEKTLESPLDCKEIKPVNPKGNQS